MNQSKLKKFLFLDFDGVLHPTTTKDSSELFSKSKLLKKTVEKSDCEIIISSSWRFHTSFDSLIQNLPTTLRKLVTGVTGDPYIGKYPRYNEIIQYLEKNNIVNVDWISLDDSFFEFPTNCQNLIICNPNIGLTSRECSLLEEWLTK
jgi:hypothetical protein